MRAPSHAGTRPLWRGRSALPVRRAMAEGRDSRSGMIPGGPELGPILRPLRLPELPLETLNALQHAAGLGLRSATIMLVRKRTVAPRSDFWIESRESCTPRREGAPAFEGRADASGIGGRNSEGTP